MGFKQVTPMSEIDRQIDEQIERQKRVLVRHLMLAGEEVVNTARSLPGPSLSVFWDSENGQPLRNIPKHTPNYIDWTANLRSSIGYVIVVDGKVVKRSSFEAIRGREGDGSQGAKEGKEFAERLAAQFPSGVALIVVAGMHYAKYVQKRGYDVTISAEHVASKLMYKLGMSNIKRISE